MNTKELKSLFLAQSYLDAWNEYKTSLISKKMVLWDYVVLTASNESQAAIYEEEIRVRKQGGFLPRDTQYLVVPDPDGKRVGSGGATFNVLKLLAGQEGDSFFEGKRILVIHSGGDSKRVPQYSVCGKLFSPVPRQLPDGRASTLFDEFIILMASMAGRISEGMLVMSGDVLLLFNALQIDAQLKGAAAISIKCDAQTGTHHGVFLGNSEGKVARFLHKQTMESLEQNGAIDAQGRVDVDTGAVILDVSLLKALYGLIRTEAGFERFVNEEARISFYGDFLYPLASDSTLEDFYKEAAEGTINDALTACRTDIWNAIHDFDFRLFSVYPSEFLHFGTTKELLELMTDTVSDYGFLGWSKIVHSYCNSDNCASYHSVIEDGVRIPASSYIEYSHIHSGVKIGEHCVISGIELTKGEVPDNVVVHGLVLPDERYVVRVYGVNDNPKEDIDYIDPMTGENMRMPLWEASIYPVCDSIEEALEKSLEAYCERTKNRDAQKAGCEAKHISEDAPKQYLSLRESFNQAYDKALLAFREKLDDRIVLYKIKRAMLDGRSEEEMLAFFDKKNFSDRLIRYLSESAKTADFSQAIRIYHLLSTVMERFDMPEEAENMADRCYKKISDEILIEATKTIEGLEAKAHFALDEIKVDLPVRVNWGGGWTDTPPQCMEQGGLVINAAISLNGKLPIHVIAKKTKEYGFFFESSDLGVKGQAKDVDDIRACRNPGDFFALHKAALLATGIVPIDGQVTIEELCKELGGGLYLCTAVDDIPKGSGLGTSSCLAAAAVKAIFDIMGISIPGDGIYSVVLAMEQIMSTGGGWQDQVGGLCPGIKRIQSRPGADQALRVEPLYISDEMKRELEERFLIIYTGQRRLARNLLRDVIGSYIAGRKDTLEALDQMKITAEKMQYALEQGRIDRLAELFNYHWELSKKLDSGCTNTCIDQIFNAVEDLIAGKFIAGAGGGGFLQVILKEGVTQAELEERINEIFGAAGVAVWKPEIIY